MTTITTRATKGTELTHNELDANFSRNAQAKVANYTVVEGDNNDTIECSGTFTVTLPDAAAIAAASDTGDFEVTLKNSSTGIITIARTTGTDTIEGTAANIIIFGKKSITLKVNQAGNGYNIIYSHIPQTVRGAMIYVSAASVAAASPLVFAGTDYDTDTVKTSTSRLTVPTGWTNARLAFCCFCTGGVSSIALYKNGSLQKLGVGYQTDLGLLQATPCVTGVLSVVAGDYFELIPDTTVGININQYSWFSMELVG